MVTSGGASGRWKSRVLLLTGALLASAADAHANRANAAPLELATADRAVAQQTHDIIVAGGLDGRVYAINAWTGDTLWTFDSGGPMVDSSSACIPQAPIRSPQQQDAVYVNIDTGESERASDSLDSTASVADGGQEGSFFGADGRAIIEKRSQSAEVMAAESAVLSELVPSYDGRLYHLSKARVKQLEMTMVDIINANGPVRLEDSDQDGDDLSDVILFGEKRTEIFALDAASGLIQPYYPVPTTGLDPAALPASILFGRAEFTTRAVHARNASATRCFRIAEYFLQFTAQPRCSRLDREKPQSRAFVPEILVLPKDPDAVEEDEGSTLTAYDPYTNQQLWEKEIPRFDVLAVYGVSAARGTTFFQWNVDGPSSRATEKRRKELAIRDGAREKASISRSSERTQRLQQLPDIAEGEQSRGESGAAKPTAKQLTRVVSRNWVSMESQYRLRLLGDNYYLESNSEDGSNLSGSEMPAKESQFDDTRMDELFAESIARRRKRRIFWEPIVNDGKRGVFITYYHVGAMMVGVLVGCLLIAWGCYVKGLSASIAQRAIKSMDGNQFFMSHVHQLTIERPGEENITISSVISRSLLMSVLDQPLPLLADDENGAATRRRVSGIDVDIDPATEAELIEKFARVAALEAASALVGSTYSSATATMMQLEYDASADSEEPASSALVVRSRGSSSTRSSSTTSRVLTLTDGVSGMSTATDAGVDFLEGAFEAMPRTSASIVELESAEDDESSGSESSALEGTLVEDVVVTGRGVSVESLEKSVTSLWSSESDSDESSRRDSSGSTSSDGEDSCNALEVSTESSAKDSESSSSKSGSSIARKGSDASSSDSSHSADAEVLFPFVCQSRFANEFEEISAIGKGGFGQVILAENRLDGRKYAIKRVGLHLKNQTSKTLQKFLREVKILALLDHPNIVRYYQAWLEKVEDSVTGLFGAPSDADSSLTGAPDRNYSMSNLLAPISEMEFSENQRGQLDFYSEGGGLDNDDDGGFEWERDSSAGASEDQGWREEDLIRSNSVRQRRCRQNVVAVNASAKETSTEEGLSAENCDHWLFIQMQYCAGRNLGDYLALPNRPMHLPKLLKIFVQIASALAHVHSCGLIHRDLKPANIFVADTDGDSIKLGDFGLSRYAANVNLNSPGSVEEHYVAASSSTISSGAQQVSVWSVSMSNMSENEVTGGVGTYLYASPEQVAGKKYNAKTDVYSLGMILFELCHERFTTTMERYIALRNARENKLPDELRWKKVSPELLRMIARLLSHDPGARPSVDEVVKWGQEMYEASLYQDAMSAMRSPLNPPRGFSDMAAASFDLLSLDGASSSTFSFHVEAKVESVDGESGGAGGDRRLPNHNLLKEICDVIAQVGKEEVEIKKCGLQLQAGVQILEFVLEARLCEESEGERVGGGTYDYKAVVVAIEQLDGVHRVRRL